LHRQLRRAMFTEATRLMRETGLLDETMTIYLKELEKFNEMRKGNLLDTHACHQCKFRFPMDLIEKEDFCTDPHEHSLESPVTLFLQHDRVQQEMIRGYVDQYGDDTVGLGRILMRAHVKRLYRDVSRRKKTPQDSAPIIANALET